MFEAYKIGITLSLTNQVSRGLMLLAGDFARTEAQAAALQKRIDSIKNDAMKGGLMLGVGAGMLALMKGPIDAAREYELALTRFKTLNLGDVINSEADKFARGSNLIGVSSKVLVDTLRESYGMIGNIDTAKQIAPMIAQLNVANSTLFGGKIGKIDEGATRSIMRFIDMRGLTDSPAEIKHGLDLAQKMVTGSGGALKFSDLEQFARRGGSAFKGMSDDGLVMMATVIQEMGGAAAGTGLMSAYQNLVAGRTTKKTMASLQDLGLAQLGYVNHGNVGGKDYKTLQITEMQDAKTLRENFPQWIMNNVIPALEKKGITDIGGQAAAVNNILSNRTGSNLGVSFATQFVQTLRDAKMVKNAMGVDATINAFKNDPNSKFADLQAKYNGLMVELGITVLPMVIRVLEKIIPMLRSMSDWINRNQTLARGLAYAFAALAAGLAMRGTVLLLSAAFRGLGLALLFSNVGGPAGIAKMAPLIGGIGTKLGQLANIGLAFGAGWTVGTILNDTLISGTKFGDWIGSLMAHLAAPFSQEARDAIEMNSGKKWGQFGPDTTYAGGGDKPGSFYDQRAKKSAMDSHTPSGSRPVQVSTQVNMDGFKVASIVSTHQSKAASGPQLGSGRFDTSMTLISPGQAIR